MISRLGKVLVLVVLFTATLCLERQPLPLSEARTPDTSGACADLRYLMANELTPSSLIVGGGVITLSGTSASVQGGVSAQDIGDYWVIDVQRNRNQYNQPINGRLTLIVSGLGQNINLEAALFRGMVSIPDMDGKAGYQPVVFNLGRAFTIDEDGVYTIVVQRSQIADEIQTTPYQMNIQVQDLIPGSTPLDTAIRDESTGLPLQPRFQDGRQIFPFPSGTEVEVSVGAVNGASSGNGTNVIFGPGQNVLLASWAAQISFAGGSFSAVGQTPEGQPRLFYLESFGYQAQILDDKPTLFAFQDSNGSKVQTDWQNIRGLWILDQCTGVKLQDGRTFIALTNPGTREVRVGQTTGIDSGCANFDITVLAQNIKGVSQPHQLCLNWEGVADQSEVHLINGIYDFDLVGDRHLTLQSSHASLFRHPATDGPAENAPLEISLLDQDVRIVLDWINMARFSYADTEAAYRPLPADAENHFGIQIDFMDTIRQTASTVRPGNNLLLFEALQDVIRIVYKPVDGQPGEEHLVLPRDEGYVELVTPAGGPVFKGVMAQENGSLVTTQLPFTGSALPDEAGYLPRGLNNTGNECYPVNTMLPEANCAANGYPNIANGNLWYAVTDHLAADPFLNLALTRSYNSFAHNVDGPFGYGWTTDFLPDYNIPYSENDGSRLVNLQDPDTVYQVGLDLTWAQRGLVTFTTGSGSRHAFVGTADSDGIVRRLSALTMPGWQLERTDLRGQWRLTQNEGLSYIFDRAGRLHAYGYAQRQRWITLDYPWQTALQGPGSIGEDQAVIITDNLALNEVGGTLTPLRRLELYFGADHHVVRSILRDMTQASADCDPAQNCFEVQYEYRNGLLTQVTYPGGQIARYQYDESTRLLVWHDDPRAPIAQTMTYSYHPRTASIAAINLLLPGETYPGQLPRLWVALTPTNSPDSRTVEVRRAADNNIYEYIQTYTYSLSSSAWNVTGDTFTLLSRISPLAAVDPFENVPTEFTWTNGLLTGIDARLLPSGAGGRNSTTFGYTPTGQFASLAGGFPGLYLERIATAESPALGQIQSVTFGDGSLQGFTYDDQGRVDQFVDRYGAVFLHRWDDQFRLKRLTRQNPQGLTDVFWTYSYIPHESLVGLEGLTIGQYVSETDPGYLVEYHWDALGRIVRINDSILGQFSFEYIPVQPNESGVFYSEIRVTDPGGARYISRFDGRGRLVETRLEESADSRSYLRKTTYEYDDTGRRLGELVAVSRWLTGEPERPLTTRYTYQDVASLAPLQSTEPDTVINGYTIIETDPYGRTRRFTYDALQRIRQTQDYYGHAVRYDYDVTGTGGKNGLRVIQREAYTVRGEAILITTTYYFDQLWQLFNVIRLVTNSQNETIWNGEWSLIPTVGSLHLRVLDATEAGIPAFMWDENGYVAGRPTQTSINQENLNRPDPTNYTDPNLDTNYDFMGRPTLVVLGEQTYRLGYCSLPQGQRLEVRSHANVGGEAFGCASPVSEVAAAIWYDAHERVVQIVDEFGVRTFSYIRDGSNWLVQGNVFPLEALNNQLSLVEDSANSTYSWSVRYDAAGSMIASTDDAGLTRQYVNDSLGRIVAITVNERPEASFTFRYNDADQVIEAQDGLQRGYRYNYDAFGNVIVQQDISTSTATTYAYNDLGLLTTIISPDGGTTTYLYEDAVDPTRLTGIISPTGSIQQYTWEDETNTLIYTNPLDQETRYRFDSFGNLWSILDSSGLEHHLLYDSAGDLVGWQRANAAQVLSLNRSAAAGNYGLQISEPTTGWVWNFTLTSQGQIKQLSGPSNNPLTFAYDPLGRLSQVIANNGAVWTIERAKDQNQVTLTDRAGRATVLHFDELYRLVQEQLPEGGMISYHYDGFDLTIHRAEGTRTYTFNPGGEFNSPEIILTAPGHRVHYVYNASNLLTDIIKEVCLTGEAVSPENPAGCMEDGKQTTSIHLEYDAAGRPIRVVDEHNNVQTFAYDDAGNLISYQNANGRLFEYEYDPDVRNRLISVTGPAGIKLLLTYNTLDKVSGICLTRVGTPGAASYEACAAGQPWSREIETYTYDSLGRLTTQSFPIFTGETELEQNILYDFLPAGDGLLTSWGSDGKQVDLIRYTDGLSLLQSIVTDFDSYDLSYTNLINVGRLYEVNEIDGAHPVDVVYDEDGRVKSVEVEGHTLMYAHSEQGYSITDENGVGIQFNLDARGLLSGIDYLGDGESQISFEYDPELSGEMQGIVTYWNGDLQAELSLDQYGEIERIAYPDPNTLLDIAYLIDPTGNTRRQVIFGLDRLLEGSTTGHIMVIGYDNADRPITMRVNSREDGSLLYMLALTYDDLGRYRTEVRQFSDGTRVEIAYTYNEYAFTQLSRREVTISGPVSQPEVGVGALAAGSLLLVLIGMAGGRLLGQPGRRIRIFLSLMLLGQLVSLTAPIGHAQTNTSTFSFEYQYDTRGNLSQVVSGSGAVCATYRYDAANRLALAQVAGASHNYHYDAYNRLTGIDDWQVFYNGDSRVPLAVYSAEGSTFWGHSADGPIFFQAQADQVQPAIFGRQPVVHGFLADDPDQQQPFLLVDPLGRVFSISPANPQDSSLDPCQWMLTPEVIANQPQVIFKGMIWDAQTNLHFVDGRAYAPDLGLFLQRDPLGPDVYGNVYSYPTRQVTPPLRHYEIPFLRGFLDMGAAWVNQGLTSTLTADAIQQAYKPNFVGVYEPFTAQLSTSSDHVRDQMATLLNLPTWLTENYNLPGPKIDPVSGNISLSPDNAPGQGGWGTAEGLAFDTLLWHATRSDNSAVKSSEAYLAELTAYAAPPNKTYLAYWPDLWRPVKLDQRQPTVPDLDLSKTPGAVWSRLPRPLNLSAHTLSVLDTVIAVTELPDRTGYQWTLEAIRETLPSLPLLPPMDEDAWLSRWFTDNILGVTEPLEARWPMPEMPEIPLYRLGDNRDWLYLNQPE